MKIMGFIFLALLISISVAFAGPFYITNVPTAAQKVTKYKVFIDGVEKGIVDAEADGSLKYDLKDLTPGKYTFKCTAINVWGESPESDPTMSPPVASKPIGGAIVE